VTSGKRPSKEEMEEAKEGREEGGRTGERGVVMGRGERGGAEGEWEEKTGIEGLGEAGEAENTTLLA
jgi:hypothetical protein